MFRLFFRSLFFVCFCLLFVNTAFAQTTKESLAQASKAFELKQQKTDVIEEQDDIKALILKYDKAPKEQKETIKKEIIKLQTKKEDEALARQEKRIERQEQKIKQLKTELNQNKKNKDKTVKEKVEFLLKEENIKKIKEESLFSKIKDKVKSVK